MQLHPLAVELLFNDEGATEHVLYGIVEFGTRPLAEHWGKGVKEVNLFICFIQPVIRIIQLVCYFLQVGACVVQIEGLNP